MGFHRARSKHIVPVHFSAGLLAAAIVAAATVGLRPAWGDTYTNAFIRNTAGGQMVGSADSDTDGFQHAVLWLANGTLVDLTPGGYTNSGANATNGTQQVGAAVPVGKPTGADAILWSGTAASAVDLNPATGFDITTQANAISPGGTQQVGWGEGSATSYAEHALLWSGTAASLVDLQPATGYDRSIALGTDGTHQVGWGGVPNATSYNSHALLWAGTAASVVDLHPASGFTDSFAQNVGGTQQVGYGYTTGAFSVHALLWTGTAASVVDLTPTGYQGATAYSTNGTQQAGYGQDADFTNRALVWSGTAASAVDLSAFLPATGTWTFSIAYDIDATGDVFGWANGTYNGNTGSYAIEWSPDLIASADIFSPDISVAPTYTADVLYEAAVPTAPEPASLSLLALATLPLLTRRRSSSPIRH